MAMPIILKGDTSAKISFTLSPDFDYAGYSLRVDFHHVSNVIYDLQPGKTVSVQYSAEDTSRFPLGTGFVMLMLENEEGVRRTLPMERVKVTDAPAEVYDCAISIDPGIAKVEKLPEKFTDNDVRTKINQIISCMNRYIAFFVLSTIASEALAASVLTAPKGEIYNDSPVVTNVSLAGLAKTDEVMPGKVEGYWESFADGMGITLSRPNDEMRSFQISPEGFSFYDYYGNTAQLNDLGLSIGSRIYQTYGIYDSGACYNLYFPLLTKDETFAVKSDIENITKDLPQTVKEVVRDVQGLVYDEKLGITWKQTMYDGNLYYIAVTNANVTEVK
jgi:hypothetical protein